MTAIPVHLKTSEKDAEKDDESEEEGNDSDDLDVVADSCDVNNEVHKEVILKEVTALIINNNCLLEIENDIFCLGKLTSMQLILLWWLNDPTYYWKLLLIAWSIQYLNLINWIQGLKTLWTFLLSTIRTLPSCPF